MLDVWGAKGGIETKNMLAYVRARALPPLLYSKTVETAFFRLLLIHRLHPLLQPRDPSLRLLSRNALLLNCLQRMPRVIPLLPQRREFVLVRPGFFLPDVHVGSDFFALMFEVHESFFEGRGELLFGKEVLFYCAYSGFLVFGVLIAYSGFGRVVGICW